MGLHVAGHTRGIARLGRALLADRKHWPFLRVVGLFLLADGVTALAVLLRGGDRGSGLIHTIISLVTGAALLFLPGTSARAAFTLLGVWALVTGLGYLWGTRQMDAQDSERSAARTLGGVSSLGAWHPLAGHGRGGPGMGSRGCRADCSRASDLGCASIEANSVPAWANPAPAARQCPLPEFSGHSAASAGEDARRPAVDRPRVAVANLWILAQAWTKPPKVVPGHRRSRGHWKSDQRTGPHHAVFAGGRTEMTRHCRRQSVRMSAPARRGRCGTASVVAETWKRYSGRPAGDILEALAADPAMV